MDAARPRPAALRQDALRVDVDEDDVAGRLPLGQQEAKVGERMIERGQPSGQHGHEDRRSDGKCRGQGAKHDFTPSAGRTPTPKARF